MTVQDYTGTAVTVAVEKGYGDVLWRNSCPIDCGWHGSEWMLRADAVDALGVEKSQHECLRAPHLLALKCLDEAADLLRQARGSNGGDAHDRLTQVADGLIRVAVTGQGCGLARLDRLYVLSVASPMSPEGTRCMVAITSPERRRPAAAR